MSAKLTATDECMTTRRANPTARNCSWSIKDPAAWMAQLCGNWLETNVPKEKPEREAIDDILGR